MTVTLYISLTLPLIIEEEVEVISFLIEQLIGEDIEEIADALLQFWRLPNSIEVGVRLNDMGWVFIVREPFSSLSERRMSAIGFHSRVKASI